MKGDFWIGILWGVSGLFCAGMGYLFLTDTKITMPYKDQLIEFGPKDAKNEAIRETEKTKIVREVQPQTRYIWVNPESSPVSNAEREQIYRCKGPAGELKLQDRPC